MRRKLLAWVLALAICFTVFPVVQAQAAVDGMIRVRLDSMGTVSTTGTMSVSGYYVAESSSGGVTFSKGDTLSVTASGSQLTLTGGGQSYSMGSSFTLSQRQDANGNTGLITLSNTRFGTRSYQGDFTFYASGNTLTIVNTVYLETYLYGVVGNEMDNAWPLEALKAQAVAARTYAYMDMTGSGTYDIGDTTNDQVYKGYRASDDVVMRAVNETAGMILTYNGQPFVTYYAASNGGETDTPAHIWSDRVSPGCYVVKEDPYDVANPDSLVSHIYFTNKGSTNKSGVETLIKNKIAAQYGVSAGSVSITGYTDVSLTNPKYSGSINYQTAVISGTASIGGSYTTFSVSASIMNELKDAGAITEDLRMARVSNSGNGIIYLDYCRYGHGIGMSQRGAQYMARDLGWGYQNILSFYYVGAQITQYAFTRRDPAGVNTVVTPTAGTGTGGSSGTATGSSAIGFAYTTTAVTARASASTSAAASYTIEKDKLVSVHEITGSWYRVVVGGKSGYIEQKYTTDYNALTSQGSGNTSGTITNPGSSGTNTGSNGLIQTGSGVVEVPVTDNIQRQILAATPVLTALDSTTAAGILNRGDYVYVLSVTPNLCLVTNGSVMGWVDVTAVSNMTDLINAAVLAQQTQSGTGTGTGTGTGAGGATARTRTSIRLRAGEGTDYSSLMTIPGGETVTVLAKGEKWCQVSYSGKTGYVMTTYLENFVGTPAASTGGGATAPSGGSAQAATATANVRMRSGAGTTYDILTTVPNGAQVTVISRGDAWSQVSYDGKTGYIINTYLNFSSTAASTNGKTAYTVGKVNLRSAADANATVTAIVPGGAAVTVWSENAGWSQVSYGAYTGYIMSQYLSAALTGSTGNTGSAGSAAATTTIVRLRAGEGTTFDILATLSAGTQVTVQSKGSLWTKVTYKNMTGYIMNQYLNFQSNGMENTGSSSGGAVSGQSVRVTTNVKLRAGDSTSTQSLGTIPGGETVTLLNQGASWSQIRYGGQTGYVMTQYLEGLGGGAAAAPTSATTTTSVNLRAGEGTSFSSLATLSAGTSVTVVSKGGDWTKVQYGNLTGYVKNDYLNFGAAGSSASGGTSSGGSAASGEKLSVTSNVNLRTGPATSYESLGTIPSGTTVTVLEKGSTWSKVSYNGTQGYVSSKFLSDPTASTATNSTLKFWLMKTTTSVIMRKSASESAQQLATVPSGTTVTVLEKGSTWSKFIYDKKIGYCKSEYLIDR